MAEQFNIDKIVMVTEGKGGSRFRFGMYPDYKIDRRTRKANQNEGEKKDYAKFMVEVSCIIDAAHLFGIEVVKVDGTEADDCIAYVINNIDLEQWNVCLLSTDSDLHQLLRPGVVQSGYNKAMAAGLSADRIPSKVWMNYKQFKDIWEIEPYLYAHVKSLSGDTSDSIKSPGGLGEKTALKLVVKYGELADIEAQVEDLEVPRLTKNAHEELKRDFNQIWFNFKLVNLNHDREGYVEIIGEDGVQYLDQVIQDFESKGRVDVNEIEELMFRDGKVGLADKINQWLYPFQK